MTQEELRDVFKYIVKKCDMLINNNNYEADAHTQNTVEDIAELCNHILDGYYGELVETKEVQEEPVSKDLHAVAKEYADNITDKIGYNLQLRRAVVYGANWQKEQMMKDAIDTTIKQGCVELGILIKGLDKGKFSFGDKVKVIIIKSE